jgi:predicted DCC family thiol-disulfide oxidoreductase YuxK
MASKVYYNSACPVCNAGIKDQRRRMEACGIADIEWVDVHTNPDAVSEVGASLEQVRERLHVKDSDGRIDVGADAFTCLWSKTRGQRWLAKLLRLPVLKQLTHSAYNLFARRLYRWNRAKGRW